MIRMVNLLTEGSVSPSSVALVVAQQSVRCLFCRDSLKMPSTDHDVSDEGTTTQ